MIMVVGPVHTQAWAVYPELRSFPVLCPLLLVICFPFLQTMHSLPLADALPLAGSAFP